MPIYSFNRELVWSIAIVDVLVRIREVTTNIEFFMMNIESSYNSILGRNWLGEMKVVASPFHWKLKFLSPKGVIVVRSK